MDLFSKNSPFDPSLITPEIEIPKLLDRVISIVPKETIDSQWASDIYNSKKNERQFEHEFVDFSDQQLILFAEIPYHDIELRPAALVYFWNNHLWPIYTLTVGYSVPSQKKVLPFRAFLPVDIPELELFLKKPTKIILLRKGQALLVVELDLPAVNKEMWQLLDTGQPYEYIGDFTAAKYWVESFINQNATTTEQALTYNWVYRLEKEASKIINATQQPDIVEQFKKEKEIVLSSTFNVFFNAEQNPTRYIYRSFMSLFWSEKNPPLNDPLNYLIALKSKLSEAPYHLDLIEGLMKCAWFSSEGTSRGQEIVSLDLQGTTKRLLLNGQLSENCMKHFWGRIPFEFPFYYEQILGAGSCAVNIRKFVSNMPLYQGQIHEGNEFVKNILAEAVSLKQWTIPFGAYVQVEAGDIKAIKFFEMGKDIVCVLIDQSGHYYLVLCSPINQKFILPDYAEEVSREESKRQAIEVTNRLAISGATKTKEDFESVIKEISEKSLEPLPDDVLERFELGIKVLLASIIRDFWVVEEREKVFGKAVVTKKLARLRSDWKKKTIVYIPRIRYVGDIKDGDKELDLVARRPHFVVGHLRRALQASESRIILARRYGIMVPEGFTFVRPHKRGDKAQERIYRSRSALQCIRALNMVNVEGVKDDWFTFELNVKNWLTENGYTVEHLAGNRNGDGGVDIQASKADEHLLVQCKYWHTVKIGPDVIREMMGTLQTFPKGSRGVIITSTELTEGAKQVAIENDVQFIENVDFSAGLNYKIATIL